MRRICLIAILLVAACAETPPPQPAGGPTAALPPPIPRGTPAQQPATQRGQNQSGAVQPTGEPSQSPFDIGGSGQGPVMPSQVSPAFRGL